MRTMMNGARIFAIRLATFSNMIGTGVLFILVAVMNADVVARGVFHAPFRGVVEVVVFSLVLIVFLQLPNVVQGDRLTRSDGFLSLMRHRRPVAAAGLSRSIDLVAGIFMAMIAWTMWPEFVESFESCHFFTQPEFGPPATGDFLTDLNAAFARCDYFGTPGILTAPWWPAKLAIFLGVALSALLFAFKALYGGSDPHGRTDGGRNETANR